MALYRNEGLASLYKGLLAAILRAVPCWSSYFWANEVLKERYGVTKAKMTGDDWSNINVMKRSAIGGVAGVFSWLICYPFDIVKTKIMCTTDHTLTIRQAFSRGYAIEGTRYFYKGMLPCLLRGYLTNSFTMPAFEYLTTKHVP